MPAPTELRTRRLLLRPWCADDAEQLLPILEANRAHLGPWIPTRVSTPVPVPELALRLAGFGNDFAAAREWRYGMFLPDDGTIVGEVGLYPRSATGRVPYDQADSVELGYWLRADRTGQGYVTEASEAMLDLARRLTRFSRVEVRCDARNAASAAVPQRLGFVLEKTLLRPDATGGGDVHLQVWTLTIG